MDCVNGCLFEVRCYYYRIFSYPHLNLNFREPERYLSIAPISYVLDVTGVMITFCDFDSVSRGTNSN